tara:strand:- start:202 stop:774 length:573 start_codon:yes stop_codon:yes gene_type:complete
MKKKKKDLNIGDNIKEIYSSKKRIGEIVSILSDNKSDPTLECIELHPKDLIPLEGAMGKHKFFKVKRSKSKPYTPRKDLFKKETFSIGKHISYRIGGRIKYGRIMGYLNQEEGLYPHSYDTGEYNGKDLLECVEINPNPGLHRITQNGEPKKFVVDSNKCKLVKVVREDSKGNATTALRLDIPTEDEGLG